jgi:hypothetical protein
MTTTTRPLLLHRPTARARRVIAWSCFFIVLDLVLAVLLAVSLLGCGDNLTAPEPFPRVAPCTQYEADFRSVDSDLVVPSLVPAPFGVRIIVDAHFDPFEGASVAVPGGRMAWRVWVYYWLDGDHLGTIGRVADKDVTGPVPRGGMCQWYDPL